MTQDEKKLLLKDLSARLPYRVKIFDTKGYFNSNYHILAHINGVVNEAFITSGMTCRTAPITDLKPFLFPMSSVSEDQAKELFDLFGISISDPMGMDYIKINECTGITFFLNKGFDVETHLDKLIDWLNSHHFDYRGLIERGLAIDATGLNIY